MNAQKTFTDIIKKSFYNFLCFLVAFNQIFPAYAQLTPDSAASSNNQSTIILAPNGVPIANIAKPNGAGVSHNKYTNYNVGSNGLILNNNADFGASQLGGVILGNPNITGSGANVIINEVTSSNPTQLQGYTEVFGKKADVLVANPNGITCNGCGFINTPKATLATGTPQLDGGGNLNNISIDDGTITIGGAGFTVDGASNKAQLLGRAIEINSDINAGEIDIITGRNDYNPNTDVVTAKTDAGGQPAFAIDSGALGGMYAGRITLRGTEDGVGFRLNGDMAASANDLTISNNGKIEFKNASSQSRINVSNTSGHDIDVTGAVSAEDDVRISSSQNINFSNDTTIEGLNAVELKAVGTITNNAGAIVSYDNLKVNADRLINDEGIIIAANDISIQGLIDATNMTTLDNLAGSIESVLGDISIFADTVNNISEINTETKVTTYQFAYSSGIVDSYINRVGYNSGDWNQYMGPRRFYAMINPLLIEDFLIGEGVSLADYQAGADRYQFTAADLLSLQPQTKGEFATAVGTNSKWDRTWGVLVSSDGSARRSYMSVQVYNDQIQEGTTPKMAGISAQSGSLTIDAIDINNDKGFLSAANDVNLNGTNLNLTAFNLTRRIVENMGGSSFARALGWATSIQHTTARTVKSDVLGNLPATVAAGGNVNGTLSGDVTSIASPITDLNDFDFGGTSHGILRTNLETGNKTSPLFTNTALFKPASDNNFLFESRANFTNLGTFFGSDYFISQITGGAFDPDTITRRLGDAFIDSRYINEQVLATGRKFLDNSFTSDTDQVKALLDRGVAARTSLALTPFIALTQEQQDALTQDIVWYEEREINGEMILVPQLYLAKATLDITGTKIRAANISAGGNVNLTANNITTVDTNITAGNDISLTATQSIVGSGAMIDGNNVTLDAGEDIALTTTTRGFGNGTSHYGTEVGQKGIITARNGNLNVTAGELASLIGVDANASNDINLNGQSVLVDALRLTGGNSVTGSDGKHHTSDLVKHEGSNVTAGGDLTIDATNTVRLRGSDLSANDTIDIAVLAGDITIDAVRNSDLRTMRNGKKSSGDDLTVRHTGSSLTTDTGDVNIKATLGDVTLQTASVDSGRDINIEATTGAVNITTTKDRDYHQHTSNKSNAVWMSYKNEGYDHEAVKHTLLTGEGSLNITAADGMVVEYRHTGDLDKDIAQLSQAPGLAWMDDLKNDPNVDWNAVVEVHKEWKEEASGLSGPASAVIAIAIALATQGLGSAVLGVQGAAQAAGAQALATANAAGASFATATNAAFAASSSYGGIIAATNAGFTSLISQATISAINNQGNIGAIFKDLTSSDIVRSVAVSSLTAGLTAQYGGNLDVLNQVDGVAAGPIFEHLQEQLITAGIGTAVETTIGGADFPTTLKQNLRFAGAAVLGAAASQQIGQAFDNPLTPETRNPALQLIGHAAVGCALGAVATGNCGTTAAAQFAGEAAALAYRTTITDDINSLAGDVVDGKISNEQAKVTIQKWQADGVNIARLTGALASAIAGGDANDVNAGANAATEAAENNVAPVIYGLYVAAVAVLTPIGAYYTTKQIGLTYVEDGAEAAAIELAKIGAIAIVTSGLGVVTYKVGGVVYKNAENAYQAWKTTQPLTSSASLATNGVKLNRKLLLDEITDHSFQKHVIDQKEFTDLGITTKEQFSKHVDTAIENADSIRYNKIGKIFYIHSESKTLVIKNGIDGPSTAFRPANWDDFISQNVPKRDTVYLKD